MERYFVFLRPLGLRLEPGELRPELHEIPALFKKYGVKTVQVLDHAFLIDETQFGKMTIDGVLKAVFGNQTGLLLMSVAAGNLSTKNLKLSEDEFDQFLEEASSHTEAPQPGS